MPAYNGTIFSDKSSESAAGEELSKLVLLNSCFEIVLKALLLDYDNKRNLLPVDFRSLSVREFGTIYEGLLESELSKLDQDLTIDDKGSFQPAQNKDKVIINSGEIYLSDRSGSRKSSGSYYTPDFCVEHLLDNSLEPALDEHLKKLSELNEVDRIEEFLSLVLQILPWAQDIF